MDDIVKRDRLIRFGHVDIPGMPNVLSHYDREKNLIRIDRLQAMDLPPHAVDTLIFSDQEYTKVNRDKTGYEPYYPTVVN